MNKLLLIFIFGLFSLSNAQIEEIMEDIEDDEEILSTVINEPENVSTIEVPQKVNIKLHESYYRLVLALAILITAPIFLFIIFRYIGKSSSEEKVTVVGLVLVIQGTLFIVTATTTSEALTASIGLLAAVGGYVLRGTNEEKNKKKS